MIRIVELSTGNYLKTVLGCDEHLVSFLVKDDVNDVITLNATRYLLRSRNAERFKINFKEYDFDNNILFIYVTKIKG
jgi:hypothetical protein